MENLLRTTKEDTAKINLLINLTNQYYTVQISTAEEYGKQALHLAGVLNLKNKTSEILHLLGNIYRRQGNYNKAIEYFTKSISVEKETGNRNGITKNLMAIGDSYSNQGDIKKALDFHLESLKISEQLNDKKSMALAYNDIGIINYKLGNYERALYYYKKAVKIRRETGDELELAASFMWIGNLYYAQEDYDNALEYQMQAYQISKKFANLQYISYSLNNIANVYYEKAKYDKAIEYYLQILEIYRQLGDKKNILIGLANLGLVYLEQNNIKEALTCLSRSLTAAQEIGYKEGIKEAYLITSDIYFSSGNYKQAYEFHQLYSQLKDSIFNEESSKQIVEMQTKYETEKKELQIENLNKDNEVKATEIKKQNIQKIAFASGFGLMLILAFVIFRGYNQKKKANEIISGQKTEVEKQKEIVDEKNKSLEVAYKHIEEKNTEILDSIRYAKRIQEAILPPQKLVKQHLEQSFILYKPKDIVAGDFYWMHSSQESGVRSLETAKSLELNEKNSELKTVSELPTPNSQLILFAVVDCTGHGVPGAFMSILGFNGLNRCVKEFGLTEPAKILDKLCELLDEAFSKSEADIKDGMDIALCSLEFGVGSSSAKGETSPKGGETGHPACLQYSGAGNSLYLVRKTPLPNGEGQWVGLTEYKADKQPIGKFSNRKPFTNHTIQLQKNDAVYIFTDGYADQFGGPKGKKFKYSQFEKLLLSIQEKTMTEQREILNNEIDKWRGGLEQIDDICIIGVRV